MSLNSARNKGNDAKVQSNVSGARAAAELLYSTTGMAYGTADPADVNCPNTSGSLSGDATFRAYITGMPSGTTVKCGVSASRNAYAFAASLTSVTIANYTDFWCADSSGVSKKVSWQTNLLGSITKNDSTCALMESHALP